MRKYPRLFVRSRLQQGEEIDLDESHSKYLTRVLRLQSGDGIAVFNGRDGEWQGKLVIDGRRCRLALSEKSRDQKQVPDLDLLFAPVKKTRTDFIVEKATELGVANMTPVITAFTQSARVRTDRLTQLAIEAAEQSERLDVPTIYESVALARIISGWDVNRTIYYCDEAGADATFADTLKTRPARPAAILIGPEGGFSESERQLLRQHSFIIPVSLGPRILRAETAVASALSIWQSILGDWSQTS